MEQCYGLMLAIAAVLAVGLGIAIAVVVMLWKKDKIRLKEEAEEQYKKGKEEAADIIRMTIDKIQDDKGKLSDMSEKDLMVETMLALGSYGRRLDRIEEKIIAISNYKAFIVISFLL